MKKIFTSFWLFLIVICCQSQTCPVNADWELGDKTNWSCKSGTYGTGTAPNFLTAYTGNTCINSGGNNAPPDANNRHTIMGPGAGTDPVSGVNGGTPVVQKVAPGNLFPSGTNTYSFRIGNDATASTGLAQAEAITYSFVVTPQNAGFTYMYAVFLEDPNHASQSQPRFEVIVRDQNGNVTPCGYYKVVAGDPIAKTFYDGAGVFWYTDWTKVGLDLTAYIGQQVSIEFRTSDCYPYSGASSSTISCINGVCRTRLCWPNGCCITCTNGVCSSSGACGSLTYDAGTHSSYAYIDAYCSPVQIIQPLYCNGASSIQLCAPPGYLSYTWPSGQPGLGGSSNNQCVTISNPVPGTTYTVNLTSVTNCASSAKVTLQALTVTATDIDICSGEAGPVNLSTSVNVPGNYTYSWAPSTGLSCTTCPNPALTTIPAVTTNYTVTVGSTAPGCPVSDVLTVNVTSINSSVTATNHVSCNGGTNGNATISPSGGNIPYTYSWSTSPSQTGTTATGLSAGTYTVTVTDSKGCTNKQNVTITQPAAVLAANSGSSPVTCFGSGNGIATANPSGGTPNYTYSWMPGGQTTRNISNLTPGTYTVTVRDSKGCSNRQSVTITQPATALSQTATAGGSITCSGGNNATASTAASGGTPNYTYTWLPGGQTTSSISNLASGTYTIIVRDANGCSNQQTVSISQPPGALTSTVTASPNVSCYGGSDGVAVASAGGGTQPYTYAWLPGGQNTSSISNLTAGTYTVNISDANNCSQQQLVLVTQPNAVLAAAPDVSSHVSCFGGNNGIAAVTPSGGTPNYTYSWLPGGQTTAGISNLASGTYTVNITDANGCTANQTVTVTQPGAALSAAANSIVNVSCYGGNNGSTAVTPTGGTPAYTYTWSPGGQTTSAISNLNSGTYTVNISDAKGCTAQQTVTITQPDAVLLATINSMSHVNCRGASNGSATVSTTGGTPAYTYAWSPGGQTGQTLNNVYAGTYTVNITDAKGCTSRQTVTLSQPASYPELTYNSTPASCTKNDGTITLSATGGVAPYTYQWSPNVGTGSAATGLGLGTYTVTLRDANGCTESIQAQVNQPPSVNAGFTFSPSSGIAPLTVTFNNTGSGGTDHRWNFGDTLPGAVQSGIFNPGHLYNDTGTYVIRLISNNAYGCADTVYATVKVNMKSQLCIPNVFTPNKDGRNDVWRLCQPGIEHLEVDIYDRWGLLIYQWDTPAGGWDGTTTTGREVPEGTYYYIVKARGADDVDYGITTGFVLLLRN